MPSHQYDPKKHHRQSICMRGWDYTAPGVYFITICTHNREHLFNYPPFRGVAENAWRHIPSHPHAQHITLDEWVVMPNHLHGILIINEPGFRGEADRDDALTPIAISDRSASPLRRPNGPEPGSIGAVVGNYKSLVTRRINNLRRTPGARVWQRGYWDRIIWDERGLNAVRRYIRNNPVRWAEDRENLDALVGKMRRVP